MQVRLRETSFADFSFRVRHGQLVGKLIQTFIHQEALLLGHGLNQKLVKLE